MADYSARSNIMPFTYDTMANYGAVPYTGDSSFMAPSTMATPWNTTPTPTSQYGGMDYLSGMTSPALANVNMAGDGSSPGFLGGIKDFFGDHSLLDSIDANGNKTQGYGGLALGAASGLFNGWLGMQQYGLAKDTLAQNKKQFDLNFAAQQKTTNARLEDQQRARVASNPGAYQSVGDYMKKYGV